MAEQEELKLVSPRKVLEQVASAIPPNCRDNIVILGSLAAAYHFFGNDENMVIRTKDVDCMLTPRVEALPKGRSIVEGLLETGWRFHGTKERPRPGRNDTNQDDLPAPRFDPPGNNEWFLELLAAPDITIPDGDNWIRLETPDGDYTIPTFRFLGIAAHAPNESAFGIAIARPEMMMLANMLEHKTISDLRMSTTIADRYIKRSNKDLGRALALWFLTAEDELEQWPTQWARALEAQFGNKWKTYAREAGDGIREILEERRTEDLEEAHHACVNGLLHSKPITVSQLRATGRRLVFEGIEQLERLAE